MTDNHKQLRDAAENVDECLSFHTPEKVELYVDFINLFVKSVAAKKAMSKKRVELLGSEMMSISLRIKVLAPDNVAKAYIYWKALSSDDSSSPENIIDAFGSVIMAMRKDFVGLTVCERDDAVGMFLRDQA